MMQPGDQVRLKHGKEEGIIIRYLDKRQVEIQTKDGFKIPVMESELVVVDKAETSIFQKPEPDSSVSNVDIITKGSGILFALTAKNDKSYSLHFINDSENSIYFSILQHIDGKITPLTSGQLTAYSQHPLLDLATEQFDEWPVLEAQVLTVPEGNTNTSPMPFSKKITFKTSFFKNTLIIPVINKNGHIIPLQGEPFKINKEEILEKLFESSETSSNFITNRPESEIDLHIEKLSNSYQQMSNSEMLQLQISVFEKTLDSAIASGMREITFIHGIGNGVLKNEIHKRLSRNKQIKFFKDAGKDKFGYGATLVSLK